MDIVHAANTTFCDNFEGTIFYYGTTNFLDLNVFCVIIKINVPRSMKKCFVYGMD